MERVAEKSKEKDGSEPVTASDDSATDSTSSESRSSSVNSSSVAQLGWPIRKASSSLKNCDLSEGKTTKLQKDEENFKLKKQDSKLSGLLFLFCSFLFLLCLDKSEIQKQIPLFISICLSYLFLDFGKKWG